MTYYQILLLSNGAETAVATLKATLDRRFSELGIPKQHLVLLDDESLERRDRKGPTVAAFISEQPAPRSHGGIEQLQGDAVTVVPVVLELANYNQYVPDALRGINGMELSHKTDPGLESVASVLLENLGLLRRSRRLFISYRRLETRRIAIQLYEILDAHGFDVFLDTRSIRPGDPFQEVLWHRLADTDVVVLLDSPGFSASEWAAAEVAHANSTSIQILQLIWPNNTIDDVFAFSKPESLRCEDFETAATVGEGAGLTAACLERITAETESLRARAIAARHAYLVQEFCSEAKAAGFEPLVQPERLIVLTVKDKEVVTVPTVGIPDAVRYQEIESIVAERTEANAVTLLYDERGIRDQWLEHIAWLDLQLKVKSLQVSQAREWLRAIER